MQIWAEDICKKSILKNLFSFFVLKFFFPYPYLISVAAVATGQEA